MIKILFTGGGTGGHIYPILAVVKELQNWSVQNGEKINLRYLGVPGQYRGILEENGIGVSKILSSKLRRYFDLRNIFDFPKFIVSFFQAIWKVLWIMPDVLFSKGGPGALPIVLACRFYRIPVIIHESDAVAGLVNRASAKHAKRIGVSFNSSISLFGGNVAVVGNPVRPSFFADEKEQISKESAKKIFGLNEEKPVILIIGGSQGSTRINDFFLDIAPELIKDFQIIHQTGWNNFEETKNELKVISEKLNDEEKRRYKLTAYLEKDLKDAYLAADIVVSRAGSGSIFEIAAMGKPSILIPLPEAASNHQVLNAYEYAKSGATIVMEESNLTPNVFLNQLKKFFSDPEILRKMGEAAKNFSRPQAAKTIAEAILELAK